MKCWNFSRYAASLAIAAALLAGCGAPHPGTPQTGGAQPLPLPDIGVSDIASPPQIYAYGTLKGETFTSTTASSHCYLTPEGPYAQFTASGKAAGRFPGTFSASGRVSSFSPPPPFPTTMSYSETFTLTSGSQTISGSASESGRPGGISLSCPNFQVAGATYAVRNSKGVTAAVYSGSQFRESFSGGTFSARYSGHFTTAGTCAAGETSYQNLTFSAAGTAAFQGASTETGT